MKIKKRILSIALAGTMALGLMPGMTMTALADGDTSTYSLTIPSTLTVANSGWNATNGISASGTLEDGKKLTVIASSNGEYALVSGENKVNYKLAESGNANTTYANATEKTAWEFTSLSDSATTQTMGIVVEDYSGKPAGTYTDTVTFTASVVNAGPVLAGITENVAKLRFTYLSSLFTWDYTAVFEKNNGTFENTSVSAGGTNTQTNYSLTLDNSNVTIIVKPNSSNTGTFTFSTNNNNYSVSPDGYTLKKIEIDTGNGYVDITNAFTKTS
ncbi:Spore Coat Protein U domain-containing protein [Lachnospiraceae bacterium XBB1006]|nr:Spore Coat Protein U domain-containing protein [Lachnospiraceae bacterium XBB1006]